MARRRSRKWSSRSLDAVRTASNRLMDTSRVDGVKASLYSGTPRSHINHVPSSHNSSPRRGAGVGSFRGDKRDKLRRAVLGRFPRVSPDLRLGRDRGPHHRRYGTDRQQAVQLVIKQSLAVLRRLRLRRLGRLLLLSGRRRWGRGLHFVFGWGAAAGVRGSRCYVVAGASLGRRQRGGGSSGGRRAGAQL